MLFKAIFSSAWESIDQNFYTRLAQTIDPIDSTITFYAEILSSGILKALDKNGEDVTENDALIALLKNPNENQNFQQFIKEWLYYHYSHGWNYIVPQSSAVGFEKRLDGKTKTYIYNTDPDHMVFNDQTSFWGFLNLNTNSKEVAFDYKPLGFRGIKYKNVIPFFDVRQNSEKPWMGISRLLALRQQIENYSLSLQGKANLIKRSGSILVSLDAAKNEDLGLDSGIGTGQFDKDTGAPIVITHKERLEQDLRETSLGNGSMGIMFSTLPLKSQPLSSGLENIKFDELGGQDARQIMNKFNVPKEFQNLILTDVAKYDEKNSSMKFILQNIIIPLAESFCKSMMKYFEWENTIVLGYDHLPVFSDNEQTVIETNQKVYDLYFKLFENKTIDEKEFKQKLQEYGIIN